MTIRGGVLGVLAGLVFSALPIGSANAFDCRVWNDLYADERIDYILDEAHRFIYSNGISSYNVNRVQIERCVERLVYDLERDLDDICVGGGRRPTRRDGDDRIRNYVRSCVQ